MNTVCRKLRNFTGWIWWRNVPLRVLVGIGCLIWNIAMGGMLKLNAITPTLAAVFVAGFLINVVAASRSMWVCDIQYRRPFKLQSWAPSWLYHRFAH